MMAMSIEMAVRNSQSGSSDRRPVVTESALDRSYGEIGISAVAAAVRYQGDAKNPAYAPAPAK